MLTKGQKEVFDFIKGYIHRFGLAPSLEEIRKRFKLASVSTAHHYVKKLQENGNLMKERNRPRSVVPMEGKQTVEVPVMGVIAAGQPIEAIEVPDETVTVTKKEIGNGGKYYALRVKGHSMIGDGIFDGDTVVVRRQETADNGQTVVAVIDDNEATLKKIYWEDGRVRLQPANPLLQPFFRDEVEVRGVVVKIIRNLETEVERKKNNDEKYTRRIDATWDYRGEKTKTYTHGIHAYPAMFIPQVARRLLKAYSEKGDTVCDIFCGSGTALVESKLLDRNAYGIDLNPLAVFLAKAKTTPLDPSELTRAYFDILARNDKINFASIQIPSFKNIDFWFKENIILKLARLKRAILITGDEGVRNFFLVAFSETVRHSSNTKTGEFKLVRVKGEKLKNHDPDVVGIFRKKVEANIGGMAEFYKDANHHVRTKIISGDSSKDNGILPASVDCIITSPPYGDSRTTVAYGQFSRLSAQWIDVFDNPNEASGVDNELLGGRASKSLFHSLQSSHLRESLDKIEERDENRAKDVLSFFVDLNECLKQAHRILKPRKYFCLVVGNRLVKQVRIPTDFIIAELAEKLGFSCEDIVVRNIPGKRMPIKNSPTNKAGVLEETMIKESIVILRKN